MILSLSRVYLYAYVKLKDNDIVAAFLQYTHAHSFNGINLLCKKAKISISHKKPAMQYMATVAITECLLIANARKLALYTWLCINGCNMKAKRPKEKL